MTKTELARYRQILEAKQAELADVLKRRDEIAIEKSPDAIDEVTRAAERELAIRNLDRESNLMRNVRARSGVSTTALSESARTATRTSVPNGWRPCPGRRSASGARKLPTAMRMTRPQPSMGCS